MRWLLICLLVSVGALLLAAAGMARHIWLHRPGLAAKGPVAINLRRVEDEVAVDEIDVEPEL